MAEDLQNYTETWRFHPLQICLQYNILFMQILVIYSGEYGSRHIANIQRYKPADWSLETWQAPATFPLVIDYPEDYLPPTLPAADLILSFAEHKGAAELIPDIAHMTGTTAVIAAVDNEAWLPRGLAQQLRGWLERDGVACATPKPLCSLTETDYGVTRRQRNPIDNPLIVEFARFFGQPVLEMDIDPQSLLITAVRVKRDAVCGCARYTAEGLVGTHVDEAEERAGMLHHHYPCLASMGKDSDFGDTLMHVSGNVLRDQVTAQVKPFKKFIQPGEKADGT